MKANQETKLKSRPFAGMTTMDRLGPFRDAPEPKEPSMKDKAMELLRFLGELSEVQDSTQAKLFGPFPEKGESGNDDEPGLEELLARATLMAASLVGQARTMNARI